MKELLEIPELKLTLTPIVGTKNIYTNVVKKISSSNLNDVIEDDNYQLISSAKYDDGNNIIKGISIQSFEDMVVFIFCKLDVSGILNGIIKSWESSDYVFFDKNKKLYAIIEDSFLQISKHYLFHKYDFSDYIMINSSDIIRGNVMSYELLKPFHQLFDEIVPINYNNMVILDSYESLKSFFLKQEIEESERFNLFQKYHLKKVSFEKKDTDKNCRKIAIIQKLDENLCVIRTFFISSYSGISKEGARMYITKDNFYQCRFDNTFFEGGASDWDFSIETFDKNSFSGTYLEYFSDIIENIDAEDRCLAIWSFLKYPIMEKLYKIPEMQDIMNIVFKLSKYRDTCLYYSPFSVLEIIFGFECINMDATDVFKFVQLNKYQFFRLIEMTKKYFPLCNINAEDDGFAADSFIYYFKQILGEDCSSVDNDTTDLIINFIEDIMKGKMVSTPIDEVLSIAMLSESDFFEKIEKFYDDDCDINECIYLMGETEHVYDFQVAKKMTKRISDNIGKSIQCNIDLDENNFNYLSFYIVYRDFLHMVEETNMQVQIKPYFVNVDELVSMHDVMTDFINVYTNNVEIDKWNNRKDYWKKFEYSNDMFSIIAPQKPDDLVIEGITLHHCVKSYISKVANGKTNVVFLRKNDDIDSPFFTIEIDNDDIVQQVHGMFNSNATQKIVSFVEIWCKEKAFKISNFNKVR